MFNIEWMKTVSREQFIEHEKHNAAYVPGSDLGTFYDNVIGVKKLIEKESEIEVEDNQSSETESEDTQIPDQEDTKETPKE